MTKKTLSYNITSLIDYHGQSSIKYLLTDDKPKPGGKGDKNAEHDGKQDKNQKKCPRNKDKKLICMKLFLHGVCDKSCNHAHKLSG
jgi:hypothetical protein